MLPFNNLKQILLPDVKLSRQNFISCFAVKNCGEMRLVLTKRRRSNRLFDPVLTRISFNSAEVSALLFLLYTDPTDETIDLGNGTITLKKIGRHLLITKHCRDVQSLRLPCDCVDSLITVMHTAERVL